MSRKRVRGPFSTSTTALKEISFLALAARGEATTAAAAIHFIDDFRSDL